MHRKASLATIIAILTGATAQSHAAEYRTKASGSWNSSSTWEVKISNVWQNASSYPQSGDVATVRQHSVSLRQDAQIIHLVIEHHGSVSTNDHTLTVTLQDGLNVSTTAGQRSGKIYVNEGGKLALTGGGTVQVDGEIFLESILSFEGSLPYTLQGGGDITGTACSARIEIAEDLVLSNMILIQGMMIIKEASCDGTATFSNKRISSASAGIVRANANGTLELACNLILQDVNDGNNRPRYEAVGCSGARLLFSRVADGATFGNNNVLQSNLYVDDCALIEFHENVATNGGFDIRQGTAIVSGCKTVTWSGGSLSETTYTVGECDRCTECGR